MTQTAEKATFTRFAFELVISAWEDPVQCEVDTRGGNQCRHPASWRTDFHGCSRGLMCTQHMHVYRRSVEAAFSHKGRRGAPCNWCGKMFMSPEAALTVTPL